MAQARTLALSGGKNEGFALLVVVPAVCRHAGGNVFHPPYWFFRLAQPYLKPPRTNRDGSCAGLHVDLRHRALFRVQQTARIDCHCTDRACRKQVFHVGYRVDRRRQFWAVGVFDAVVDCVFVIPVTLVFRRPFSFRRPYLVIMSSEIFYKAKSWQTKDSSTASTPSTPACGKTRNRLPNSTFKKAKTMPACVTCWKKRQTKTCAYTLPTPTASTLSAKARGIRA